VIFLGHDAGGIFIFFPFYFSCIAYALVAFEMDARLDRRGFRM